MLSAIAGAESGVAMDTPLGEVLSSLERVELAARLEALYDTSVAVGLFTGEATVGEIAATLRHTGVRSGDDLAVGHGRDDRPAGFGDERTEASMSAPGIGRHADRKIDARTTVEDTGKPPDPARWRYWLATRAGRFVLRECVARPLATLLVRLEVDNVRPTRELVQPFLLAANHISPIDPVIMFALPARVRASLAPAARWGFFTSRPYRRRLYTLSVLGLNVFPLVQVGDWRPTLRIGGELVDRGHSILIYPEGSISSDGETHAFKPGVAVMSRELHLPVVPCGTAGIERVVPHGHRVPRRSTWRRPVAAVCFGEPMSAIRPGDDLDAFVTELERRVRGLRDRARALADGIQP